MTIEVSATPTITANNDNFSATGIYEGSGGTTPTVFTNDDANGTTPATDALIDNNINITNDGGLSGITINTDGTINVPSTATAGSYTVTYQICLTSNNTVCDTATAVIVVYPAWVQCNFDTTDGSGQDVEVYRTSMSNTGSFSVDKGVDASVSSLNINEIFVNYTQLTNSTGADISDAVIFLRSFGYWSQLYQNSNDLRWDWDLAERAWTATATDGSGTIYIRPVSAVDGSGTSYPIELLPYLNDGTSSGYYLEDGSVSFSASLTDNGNGAGTMYSETEIYPDSNILPAVRLGAQADGAVINNLVITLAVFF